MDAAGRSGQLGCHGCPHGITGTSRVGIDTDRRAAGQLVPVGAIPPAKKQSSASHSSSKPADSARRAYPGMSAGGSCAGTLRPIRTRDMATIRPEAPRHGVSVPPRRDRKSTRLNSSHVEISYAVFCLKKKKKNTIPYIQLEIIRLRICT